MFIKGVDKSAQVTIFIIIAVIIIGAILVFFMIKEGLILGAIPENIEPVYNSFLSCLEDDISTGIDVLESQAGYIVLPNFEPGSNYMPFSSQLDFLGNPIPYWYYVSGNNLPKEQIPSKSDMEQQLKDFVEEKIAGCRLDSYYSEGFEISRGGPKAEVTIRDNDVTVNLGMSLNINRGEDSAVVTTHKVVVNSKLGALYDSARTVYDNEQESLFLENYAFDTLNLYAPVDGVELSCSPKTWIADDVFDELQDAIEANTLALKVKGGDYSLRSKEDEYFEVDIPVNENVRFINSKKWPNSFEVSPSEESVLIAKPVGDQPGLGILGFCYVPYHFVYNVKYPVLVQVSSEGETFQFPVAVVLQGNHPRNSLDTEAVDMGLPQLCSNKNTLITVNTFDTKLNSVEADISYECFGTKCDVGKSSMEASFPQCTNGYIMTKAEGFKDTRYLFSSTEPGSVDIILDKLYEKNIELKLDGKNYRENAIISFVSDDFSKTIVHPDQKLVQLSEGLYNITMYIYKDSSLKLEAVSKEQCVDMPVGGVGGFFGLTKEKCFNIEIPEQIVSNALSGGGKLSRYISETELESSNTIEINAGSLPLPVSVEQLQNNYVLFEDKGLGVTFR